jgi:hypothetical protein
VCGDGLAQSHASIVEDVLVDIDAELGRQTEKRRVTLILLHSVLLTRW